MAFATGVASARCGLLRKRRAGEDEAPRQLDRLADADAHAGVDDRRRSSSARAATRNGRRSRRRPLCAWVTPSAWQSRPGPEQSRRAASTPRRSRIALDARRRLEGADQHPGAVAGRRADEVEAPVDAVRAIDVGAAGRPEHHGVARRVAAEAVRRRIVLVVGLGLDDPPPTPSTNTLAPISARATSSDEAGKSILIGEEYEKRASRAARRRRARVDRIRASRPAPAAVSDRRKVLPQYVMPKRGADGVRRPRRLARARRDDDAAGALVRAQVRRRHERGGGQRRRRLPQLQRLLHARAEGRRAAARRCRPDLPGRRHDQPVRPRSSTTRSCRPRATATRRRRWSAATTTLAARFHDGSFATLYLSPKDYHRIHMPCDGTLTRMIHVPGALFSVNPTTARGVPGLFARNERVVCVFDSPARRHLRAHPRRRDHRRQHGDGLARRGAPAARAPRARVALRRAARSTLKQGEEMGRFMLGSTVVLLFPKRGPASSIPPGSRAGRSASARRWPTLGHGRIAAVRAVFVDANAALRALAEAIGPRTLPAPRARLRRRRHRPRGAARRRSPARRSRSSTTRRCRSRSRAAAAACATSSSSAPARAATWTRRRSPRSASRST